MNRGEGAARKTKARRAEYGSAEDGRSETVQYLAKHIKSAEAVQKNTHKGKTNNRKRSWHSARERAAFSRRVRPGESSVRKSGTAQWPG